MKQPDEPKKMRYGYGYGYLPVVVVGEVIASGGAPANSIIVRSNGNGVVVRSNGNIVVHR